MFTGIIEELGKVQLITSGKIKVLCKNILSDVKLGDSVAHNGVCLTVVEYDNNSITADISPETLRVSNLGSLKVGDYINLERALKADGRFSGHIVSGHIDSTAKFINITRVSNFYQLSFKLDNCLTKYIVSKGSICINGISLTIADINNDVITIAVIPHTYEYTNLKFLKNGDFVNIEVDILSKYIEKFLLMRDNKSRIDLEFLKSNGF